MIRMLPCAIAWVALLPAISSVAMELQVATFQVDVTPPLGSPLCDGLVQPAREITDPLSARGIVLQVDDQQPMVLVAVDWVGIGNEGHTRWRQSIAKACNTTIERVCVHALHQHDAPGCDFLADRILQEVGLQDQQFSVSHARDAILRVAEAAKHALSHLEPVTHIGYGMGRVEKVASNRRILGPDGKVRFGRMTATRDPAIRAFPEGTIDPFVRLVSFWHGEQPIAVLSYYATHPQSHYGKGFVSADFVGMAREQSEIATGASLQIHFNGAGGNIGAGKYNDGAPDNRPILAHRLAEGMQRAWEASSLIPVADISLDWKTREVQLPLADWYEESDRRLLLNDEKEPLGKRVQAARAIAWAKSLQDGQTITVARLRLGPIDILHLPGELFVEYQLAAQQLAPERFICLAAYGNYGPGYIGTAAAYVEGGYETSIVSRVSPRSEAILMEAIKELLE